MTPVGGLSLIAHSIILVISMMYRGIKNHMHKLGVELERPRVTYVFSSASGDSILRRALSYSIVGLVFMWVSSGAFGMISAHVAEIDLVKLKAIVMREAPERQTASAAIANDPRLK